MVMASSDIARSDGATADSEVDIILLLQERDAYKQETEKLRKIIERQRFIIKSLQDQISRKPGSSAATTPSIRNSDLSPEQTQPLQTSGANALGLSALDISSLPQAAPGARKVSQSSGSGSGSPQAAVASGDAGARPWAKSTRLSEIYADYTARHNSTAAIFKSSNGLQGASFVDSLKASVRAAEWSGESSAQNLYPQQVAMDIPGPDLQARNTGPKRIPEDPAYLGGSRTGPETQILRLANVDGCSSGYDTGSTQQHRVAAANGEVLVPELEESAVSPTSHSTAEHLVLCPVPLGDAEEDSPLPAENGNKPAVLESDKVHWGESRIEEYEYSAAEQKSMVPEQRRPSEQSIAGSSTSSSNRGVRWDIGAAPSPREAASPLERNGGFGRSHSAASFSPFDRNSGSSQAGDQPPGPPLTSLQNIEVQIKDSRVKIDERGKEVNVYMVDVVWRRAVNGMSLQEMLAEPAAEGTVLWTVEKRYSDFLALNTRLRHVIHREGLVDKLERLPEKDIFRPNAPTKNDKRKQWFERYLHKALELGISDKRDILEFLSTDLAQGPETKMPILLGHKEGFLVKKGKNFGGWKRRYYVCKSDRPVLEYSEHPGGPVLGVVSLTGAVVKTGKARSDEGKGDMFRHAFLIEERARRKGREPIAHPLWADSDRERDEWVMALRYVIVREAEGAERAAREVTKLVKHARSRDARPLMIHQLHTSITHEMGARRSAEHARREMSAQKGASPLSRQMWPATASLDNMARITGEIEDDTDPVTEKLYSSLRGQDRPRSVSLPPHEMEAAASGAGGFGAEAPSDGASAVSTIESSLYSSCDAGAQHAGRSMRSLDDGNSYGSVPASPVRADNNVDSPLTGSHTPAGDGDSSKRFTRNSTGRIVHEEEPTPALPAVTPHVTDDILGVGRSGSRPDRAAPTRSREDKKRGRITFMWGKRRAADGSTVPTEPLPGDTAPRRLRRGSVGAEARGPVFEQSLERAVQMTRVRENYQLPAVVYRCIEYLDTKKAWQEEGIYRQSGSTSALQLLRKEFDSCRDVNLLRLSKPPDVHVVASLLKAYLRDLPENILTARLCLDFHRVVDLVDRRDRVCELGRLVSELPLPNYTLLRALSAHLIRIVQHAETNRMTLRNIGIVFSPSLGIPVGVISLLMIEFDYIFWVNDSGVPEPRRLAPTATTAAGTAIRSNRNSIQYKNAAPRELISQEAAISIPATIAESALADDDDDIISASDDPMMQLNRYASSSHLRSHDHPRF
ncbi:Rho GTPase activating protein [Coemansia brasiliensis]|uniref:Rho GTPase activating protein n=1 Tax=Coemansia brasiliensis TaxID=2650707 RepID=A0A9W8I7G3_9FUNG|nr:Rho GTPase activating protein [Coemansia brasiliensis]